MKAPEVRGSEAEVRETATGREQRSLPGGVVQHHRIFGVQALLAILSFSFVLVCLQLIYSSSSIQSFQHYGNQYYFVTRQLIFALPGVALLVFFATRDYRYLQASAGRWLLLSFVLLLILWIPGLGKTVNGARRWLQFGPLTFQPSELVKLSLVIFLAYVLTRRPGRKSIQDIWGYLRIWLLCLPFLILVLATRDLGTTVILGAATFMLLYLSGARLLHLGVTVALAIPPGYLFCHDGYRLKRLVTFLNPWADPYGAGYQLVQSLLALGRGGLFGVGPGNGTEKLFYLPDAHTDFIFAVLGEEFGLAGCILFLILFLLFMITGVRIALRAPDRFGALLASGITFLLGLQVVLNIGVVMGLLPTKGMVLPFLSYGGSALLVNLTAVGILMSVAREGVLRPGARR